MSTNETRRVATPCATGCSRLTNHHSMFSVLNWCQMTRMNSMSPWVWCRPSQVHLKPSSHTSSALSPRHIHRKPRPKTSDVRLNPAQREWFHRFRGQQDDIIARYRSIADQLCEATFVMRRDLSSVTDMMSPSEHREGRQVFRLTCSWLKTVATLDVERMPPRTRSSAHFSQSATGLERTHTFSARGGGR